MNEKELTKENAYIFRITHIANVPWILTNGLHCRNSITRDPNFHAIGDPDLIEKRNARVVKIPPGGTLSDYVPFYFTPFSPMLYKIKTGHGVNAVSMNDIVILASSLHKLTKTNTSFLYTDRHAYLETANYFDDLKYLDRIGWHDLAGRDFQRDMNRPDKLERYQAETLIHKHLPISTLGAIICYCLQTKSKVLSMIEHSSTSVRVLYNPNWFF